MSLEEFLRYTGFVLVWIFVVFLAIIRGIVNCIKTWPTKNTKQKIVGIVCLILCSIVLCYIAIKLNEPTFYVVLNTITNVLFS